MELLMNQLNSLVLASNGLDIFDGGANENNPIIKYIKSNAPTIKWFLIVAIAGAGLFFAGGSLIKAMKDFRDQKGKEGLKNLAFAILIAALATGGIVAIFAMAKQLSNDAQIFPNQ